MNILSWISFILTLWPKILELIAQVEQFIGSGNGGAKKELVTSAVIATAEAIGASPEQIAGLSSSLSRYIDSAVSTLNLAGTLPKLTGAGSVPPGAFGLAASAKVDPRGTAGPALGPLDQARVI